MAINPEIIFLTRKEKAMNISERIIVALIISFALAMGAGCATSKTAWISKPAIQTAGNVYYEAKIEPVKQEHDFYVSFRLEITNKTDTNLEIDWNKTRYIHNNKTRGVFVFKGIKPEDIKNSTVSPDVISPNGTFSKVISPYKLLARAPLGGRSMDSGIMPGILPTGDNGILLVIWQKGKEITEKLTVNIEEK